MKIDYSDILKVQEALQGGKKKTDVAGSKSDAFNALLNKTLEDTTKFDEASKAGSLCEITSSCPLQYVMNNGANESGVIAEQMEFTIDLLDQYASMLADPKKSLKDIEPVLSQLADETESLKTSFADKNIEDPELKSMLNDLMFSVMTEQIRFQRGDYIDR